MRNYDLKKKIAAEHGVPLQEQRIHLDRGCKDTPCPVKKTLAQIGLRHGSMVYIKFDATKVSVVAEKSSKRVIAEDGSLVAVSRHARHCSAAVLCSHSCLPHF